nr:DNA mismatch endonuclease Vsr [Citrobacter freundii]
MKKVRREGTGPELRVRKYLFSKGLRYQVCRKDLPGSPDIVFSKKKIAIFVHGCFWHQHLGCRKATIPKSNTEFWITKFKKTKERDVSAKGKLNLIIHDPQPASRADMASEGLPRLHAPIQPTCS